jgi:uncharacterized protein (DUF2384 family)
MVCMARVAKDWAHGRVAKLTRTSSSKSDEGYLRPVTAKSVRTHALETFGSSEKATHWLNRPNHLFRGKRPLDVIESDPMSVEAALIRIDYGVYV